MLLLEQGRLGWLLHFIPHKVRMRTRMMITALDTTHNSSLDHSREIIYGKNYYKTTMAKCPPRYYLKTWKHTKRDRSYITQYVLKSTCAEV